ncbi:Hypothetical_protein [Hexamita inflata]|uniref:Hypothetical_protein n=1 Tax=Hexamita inflata TaxID=28002 RepID=A0AA86V1Q8_9EUKA|nr:Hypothetical protein HINF_LOCUS64874 [Hexamita inflata]
MISNCQLLLKYLDEAIIAVRIRTLCQAEQLRYILVMVLKVNVSSSYFRGFETQGSRLCKCDFSACVRTDLKFARSAADNQYNQGSCQSFNYYFLKRNTLLRQDVLLDCCC